ncbi:hypothetical protein KUTeg_010793 [Tegillarca granosa]|uniref:Integrase n=1 Tax=Tegillarca granosa TaxID=220873 RepID=A0ABQ9F218_TEGGR|nr:hypothetical protein KUTeg_010793 [Tegillarca granosa]
MSSSSSSSSNSSSSLSQVDKKRFASLDNLTQSDYEKILNDSDAKNTRRATLSAVRTFKAYLEEKGLIENFETLPKSELDQILSQFYREARQENGEKYRKSSLYAIRHGLKRHLSSWSIDLTHDGDFKESNKTFSLVTRDLKKEYGDVKHYPPISQDDLTKLYRYFGDLNNSERLQEKVYFDLVIHFGRRGLESFHKLKVSNFAVEQDTDGRDYVCMTPNLSSTNHRLDDDASARPMYSIPGDNLCPVKSFVEYKKKLNSTCDRLFQRPSKKGLKWYAAIPLGHNSVSQMMPNLSVKVGLSKRYSNHSLRATSDHVRESQGNFANRLLKLFCDIEPRVL